MTLHREVLPPRERLTREDYERTHYAIQRARRQASRNERDIGVVMIILGALVVSGAVWRAAILWWLS